LLTGRHSAQRVGERGLSVQWRYEDGRMLCLELNLGADPLQVEPQHLGPVEAELVFSHRCPAETRRGTWPAYSARWTFGEEITL
jgi:maltooligosyltrehalose trehalohydrolase